MSKYGIFKANIFVKRPPLKMLDINDVGEAAEICEKAAKILGVEIDV